MNMHPGDRRSIEENEEADLAKKEENTPIGHSRLSEMTKTPIRVEAEVGFSVGLLLLISRFRWVLFICAFGAVYAAAFWGFVGLISAAFIIGRGFHQKGGQIDSSKPWYHELELQYISSRDRNAWQTDGHESWYAP